MGQYEVHDEARPLGKNQFIVEVQGRPAPTSLSGPIVRGEIRPGDLAHRMRAYLHAIQTGDIERVKQYIADGGPINVFHEDSGCTALHIAAEGPHAATLIPYFLALPDCNFMAEDERYTQAHTRITDPALKQAANARAVEQYIHYDIDPNWQDPPHGIDRGLLHTVPHSFDNREADTNSIAGLQYAYNTAASRDEVELAQKLLAAGAAPNALDIAYGMSTTHLVVAHRAIEYLKVLVKMPDVDFLMPSAEGELPSYYADDPEVLDIVRAREEAQARERGVDLPKLNLQMPHRALR